LVPIDAGETYIELIHLNFISILCGVFEPTIPLKEYQGENGFDGDIKHITSLIPTIDLFVCQ